tara:strand:+ start:635 stop:1513 length:879 start_codon:yes stop_codon:yes gene_type:complete
MKRKGIILLGGHGSRLYPITKSVNKHLLPIYDKPMVYYSLSILMLVGIREILFITNKEDLYTYKKFFSDGSNLGLKIEYKVQSKPRGIAEAFIIGEKFLDNKPCALILGDNIFYGNNLSKILKKVNLRKKGATVFAYNVNDPSRYGILEFGKNNKIISIREKPKKPKSNFAVTGLYFYDQKVIKYAKEIKPSARGELEITDINKKYLENKNLNVEKLDRGYAWLDTGTNKSLIEAASFISNIEERQGLKISCIEEIAFKKKFITKKQLLQIAKSLKNSEYGNYLKKISNYKY